MLIVPIISQLKTEQTILSDRREIAFDLHDELQRYISTPSLVVDSFYKDTKGKKVEYTFRIQENLIKGCA